jgi:hypothetical protein
MYTVYLRRFGLTLAALAITGTCLAQEAVIRKNLAQRYPEIKAIEEISKAPMPGLYELRVNGSEIYYTDAQADFLIVGNLYDTKQKRNLTEERIDKLTAVKFDSLPFKDAFTIVRGNGERKLAVFEDPNCGYCKRFERDLQTINNVTVYIRSRSRNPSGVPKTVFRSGRTGWCTKRLFLPPRRFATPMPSSAMWSWDVPTKSTERRP